MYKEFLMNHKNKEKALKQVFGGDAVMIDSHIDFQNKIVIKGNIYGGRCKLEIHPEYYTTANLIELGGGWNEFTFYKPFILND